MEHRIFTLFILLLLPFSGVNAQAAKKSKISKIAFGSCASQDHPLPIFDVIVKHKPDLFIFLGDNIYADTEDANEFKAKYAQLAAKPGYQKLKKSTPIVATWDDHDYGDNDAGADYDKRELSKEIFLDFFDEPKYSERRKREGIYTSYEYVTKGKKLQVIMLDCRYFRDKLKKSIIEINKDEKYFYKLDYTPHSDDDKQFLGEEQWKWLEAELSKDADIRLICSGSQFGHEYNGYESWTLFPHERQRMLDLIKKTKANGVMFLSGDVHYAEISKVTEPDLYPIYDITSSGLSSTWKFATPNGNRIEGPVMDNHFGLLTIDWNKKNPAIKMEIWDINNNQRIEYTIKNSDIAFEKIK
jgi:alkaline phosphatase D